MDGHEDFLYRYLCECPAPLALERSFECVLLSRQEMARPILDLGCGEGLFAKMLFKEPVDLGVDPNPRELERARQCGAHRELHQSSGDAIEKPSESFNTIISNSVLEHIPILEPVLIEAFRLLRPGGNFYATVPSENFDKYSIINQVLTVLHCKGLAARYRKFFNKFWMHFHYYDPQKWTKIFQKAGFKIKKVQSYCPPSVCLLNDFMAPFCFVSFCCKKMCNRWHLLPPIRKRFAYPYAKILKPFLVIDDSLENGGLLLFSLSK